MIRLDTIYVLPSVSVCKNETDEDGEVLLPEGCKLDQYRLNPVVLFNHDLRDPVVGKGHITKHTPEAIEAFIELAPTSRNRSLCSLFYQEKLRFTVGYIEASYIEIESVTEYETLEARFDLTRYHPRPRKIVTDWTLLSLSFVAV